MKSLYYLYRKRKIVSRETQRHEFDSSAVGDLAFLLLIFFIVTSSFILRQGIFFTLPSKNASSKLMREPVVMNLYPTEKSFILNNEAIDRDDLIRKLKKEKSINKNFILSIFMKPRIKYERFVDALSVSKECKIRNVSLKYMEEEK